MENKRRATYQSGVASLSTMLILGGVIIEIGLVGSVLVYLLGVSNFGTRLSGEALAAAQGGVHDGILRVIRDNPYTSGSSYDMQDTGNADADVTITNDFSNNRVTVEAVGSAFGKRRKLVATLSVDPVTRLVSIIEIVEEAF